MDKKWPQLMVGIMILMAFLFALLFNDLSNALNAKNTNENSTPTILDVSVHEI